MKYIIYPLKEFYSWSLTKKAAFLMLLLGLVIALWVLLAGKYFVGRPLPDPNKARELQPFITALVAPLLTLGSALLVLENLRSSSIQNFSNNFFKLIDQHHKLVDNINTEVDNISIEGKVSNGSAFFDDLSERIACDYYHADVDEVINADEIVESKSTCPYYFAPSCEIALKGIFGRDRIIKIYDFYFHIHQSDLGHYFRHLYHIVRYAERSNLGLDIQKQHVKILRAQLSNYEILMLAYNGMHPFGAKFHPLIEKFELLKNLNTEEALPKNRLKRIIDIEVLKEAYPHFKKQQESDN